MTTTCLAKNTELETGVYGMQVLIKLIKIRVDCDLGAMQKQLQDAKLKVEERDSKGKRWYNLTSNDKLRENVLRLEDQILLKRRWIGEWTASATNNLMKVRELNGLNQTCQVRLDDAANILGVKLFLVIQEALFYPIYALLENYPKDMSEVDAKSAAAVVCRSIHWPENIGHEIYSNTHRFFRKASGFWKSVVGWTLGGTLLAAATAGLAAPFIAGTVGGFMGLSGAAATSAGLAFFGGGSLAAGGAGMAGGMMVLVGGGGLLGAGAGIGAANFLNKSDKDSTFVACARVLNYAKFLEAEVVSNKFGQSVQAQTYLKDVLNNFLESKHEIERELLLPKSDQPKDKTKQGLEQIKILELTLEELLLSKN